jgi:hypothetical protein
VSTLRPTPFVIDVSYLTPTGDAASIIIVKSVPLADLPDVDTLIPQAGTFLRADVFPASHFADMRADRRPRYAAHYSQYLLWLLAQARHAEVHALHLTTPERAQVESDTARWITPLTFAEA